LSGLRLAMYPQTDELFCGCVGGNNLETGLMGGGSEFHGG
jgi:hypothetical protein